MSKISLQITKLPNTASGIRKRLPFAIVDGENLIIESQLAPEAPVNDHLVWFWSFLKHERRLLKSLQSEGAIIIIDVVGQCLPVEIKPNGAELLHLLGVNLRIG